MDTAENAAALASGASILAFLGLEGNDTITATSAITLPLAIWGNDGNDTLNTSASDMPTELDGGQGDDRLTSGNGVDTLKAGPGTNTLAGGNGRNRFVGGGSDTMTGGNDDDRYEVHFSSVVINDVGGGLDLIDLSAAPAGVTLNFSETSGSPQNVFPTSAVGDPYHGSTLALNGSFQKLIGSPFGDVLAVATSGTEIEGGAGNDQLAGTGSGLSLDGGTGNDTFVLQSSTGKIVGGEGDDTIIGSIAATTTTIIDTGSGADVVQVSGPATGNKAPVIILGGDGDNQVTANNITGKIIAEAADLSSGLPAFGTTATSTSRLTANVNNSQEVDIFGNARSQNTIQVATSQDIGIFGGGDDRIEMTSVTMPSSTIALLGLARGRAMYRSRPRPISISSAHE